MYNLLIDIYVEFFFFILFKATVAPTVYYSVFLIIFVRTWINDHGFLENKYFKCKIALCN